MGMAPMAYTLWTRFMRHAPTDPAWPNRDRFVLSAGHASMLLYSLLYLTGYGLTLEDLQSFRQWGSRTPGHPEHGMTAGVEATTGPLGQGFANAVGMAIAQSRLAAEFNRPGHKLIDHLHLFDLLRRRHPGGHLGRGRVAGRPPAPRQAGLPVRRQRHPARRAHSAWPSPRASSIGSTPTAGTPSGRGRQRRPGDRRRDRGRPGRRRPSLIAVRTHIGFGAPTKHDSQKAHGSPLGEDEVRGAKIAYGWDPDKHFFVPDEALATSARPSRGEKLVAEWHGLVRYAARLPGRGRRTRAPPGRQAGRRLGQRSQDYGPADGSRRARPARRRSTPWRPVPELFGGAADLSESNLTDIAGGGVFEAGNPAVGTSASASASTPWAGSPTASPVRRLHPVRRHVPHVQRLHARLGQAGAP
jgi:transketolase